MSNSNLIKDIACTFVVAQSRVTSKAKKSSPEERTTSKLAPFLRYISQSEGSTCRLDESRQQRMPKDYLSHVPSAENMRPQRHSRKRPVNRLYRTLTQSRQAQLIHTVFIIELFQGPRGRLCHNLRGLMFFTALHEAGAGTRTRRDRPSSHLPPPAKLPSGCPPPVVRY